MSQQPAASGQFDRAVNPADGVGSLKQGPRTHPAHAEGRLIYNGVDRDGQNGNSGFTAMCGLLPSHLLGEGSLSGERLMVRRPPVFSSTSV